MFCRKNTKKLCKQKKFFNFFDRKIKNSKQKYRYAIARTRSKCVAFSIDINVLTDKCSLRRFPGQNVGEDNTSYRIFQYISLIFLPTFSP